MKVGVLALQGAYEAHVNKLKLLGCEVVEIRRTEQLSEVSRLILPGGESTTMLKQIENYKMWRGLKEFCETHPVWGICAGSILLAQNVTHPAQKSLGIMEIQVKRNGYGRQLDSFSCLSEFQGKEFEAIFIRAPLITEWSDSVEVLVTVGDVPVCVKSERTLVTTFHPELSQNTRFHEYFLNL